MGAPNRNGGRHCCQPPLRRAKDLPVFVTWPQGARFRSWLTSSGVASHQTAPSCEEPDRSTRKTTRRITNLSLCPAWPESQNRPMFRGPSWGNSYRVPLCSSRSEDRWSRVARQKETSSGASPADLASIPERTSALPAGRDRTFGHLPLRLPLPALGEAGTAVPITKSPCTSRPSRKSEKYGKKPVDNGDIGNNNWNLVAIRDSRLGSGTRGCRSVPPRLLRPSA
jgi:hypothetical protein